MAALTHLLQVCAEELCLDVVSHLALAGRGEGDPELLHFQPTSSRFQCSAGPATILGCSCSTPLTQNRAEVGAAELLA